MQNFSFTFFDRMNLLLLVCCWAVLYFFIPVVGTVDQFFSRPWVDSSGHYALINNVYLNQIGHNVLKYIVIFIAALHLICLVYLKIYKKNVRLQKICMMVLLSMACSVSVIALLKSLSSHACPWSMVEMHLGQVRWHQTVAMGTKCFPGGHASGGFSLIILFFAYRHFSPRISGYGLVLSLLLGLMMSWVQIVRGAHFLSHNLWSLWWSWLIAFVVYKAFNARNGG